MNYYKTQQRAGFGRFTTFLGATWNCANLALFLVDSQRFWVQLGFERIQPYVFGRFTTFLGTSRNCRNCAYLALCQVDLNFAMFLGAIWKRVTKLALSCFYR